MCLLVLRTKNFSWTCVDPFRPALLGKYGGNEIVIAALSEFRDSLRRGIKKSLLSKDKLLVFLCIFVADQYYSLYFNLTSDVCTFSLMLYSEEAFNPNWLSPSDAQCALMI